MPLGLKSKFSEIFSVNEIIPSAGQGIIALQCREKDNKIISILKKIGYSKKIKNRTFIIKAFQRRFRQSLVNGKIDKECLIISKSLLKLS